MLHFHGGLVSESTGRAIAERLVGEYSPAHAVFFIWESGFLETVRHSLSSIAGESIFNRLLETISKWAVGKLQTALGLKAGPGSTRPPQRHRAQDRVAEGGRPDSARTV